MNYGLNNNYHDCKLTVCFTAPGSLASFLYAYCKTVGCPSQIEPAYIRKAVSFAKLARYVRTHITNDFDGWYRMNEDSQYLFGVLASIINKEDGRNEIYVHNNAPRVSAPFTFPGINRQFVLVRKD